MGMRIKVPLRPWGHHPLWCIMGPYGQWIFHLSAWSLLSVIICFIWSLKLDVVEIILSPWNALDHRSVSIWVSYWRSVDCWHHCREIVAEAAVLMRLLSVCLTQHWTPYTHSMESFIHNPASVHSIWRSRNRAVGHVSKRNSDACVRANACKPSHYSEGWGGNITS